MNHDLQNHISNELLNTIRRAALKKAESIETPADILDVDVIHQWPTFSFGVSPIAMTESHHTVRLIKGPNGWEAGDVFTILNK
ncbi:hypothetical protein IC235_17655 [Hymenobacter sp. BT664]|uniref:Uncharacterized protein n=1 Tax=Hymenobacter montanus TaxID=2771359 RepID=A0A927GL12_9BACT|nr:hypothetical protein [Hymenobacter montanus]MBD2769719.1 hypothetical protein [Hymenobacter montanus]